MSDDEYDPEPLSPDEVAFGRLMLVAGELQRMSAYAPTGDAAAEVAHVARHFYPSERRREIAAAERRGAERMRAKANALCVAEAEEVNRLDAQDERFALHAIARGIRELDLDAVLAGDGDGE